MKKVVVVGSLNMDLVMAVERMPKVGETIKGENINYLIGGKGANQAVAAARLSNEVNMIGCIGKDTFGEKILKHLKDDGVNVEAIKVDECTFTGLATIFKTPENNSIVVIPGANDFCDKELVDRYEEIIKDADILVTQLEIPIVTVKYVLEVAKKHGVKTILNPAPAQKISRDILCNVDILTPNETEFEIITGQTYGNDRMFEDAMIKWQKDNNTKLVVTRGAMGSSFVEEGKVETVEAMKVKAIDTTGAGDTFNGALAHSLANGYKMRDAVRFAGLAASLSVTKFGAQTGMPTLEEINNYI
ncbi:ribokinase [Clostridium paraputrificum]|uniref:ribokinase n=1 Tax=Clostridium paraputrificum TaxID=29363 RepID=UPI003D350C8B